jgi:DNA-binding CsgD family transcriptional regulator
VSRAAEHRHVSPGDVQPPECDSAWPICAEHPGAPMQRARTRGAQGLAVYLRCRPQNGDPAHLVRAPDYPRDALPPSTAALVTDVEREILVDAAAGLTMSESAAKRDKGIETVKSQRRHILTKLGARNITHAVSIAVRDGLIERLPRGG